MVSSIDNWYRYFRSIGKMICAIMVIEKAISIAATQ